MNRLSTQKQFKFHKLPAKQHQALIALSIQTIHCRIEAFQQISSYQDSPLENHPNEFEQNNNQSRFNTNSKGLADPNMNGTLTRNTTHPPIRT